MSDDQYDSLDDEHRLLEEGVFCIKYSRYVQLTRQNGSPVCAEFDCPEHRKCLWGIGLEKAERIRQEDRIWLFVLIGVIILAVSLVVGFSPRLMSNERLLKRLSSEDEGVQLNAAVELADRGNPIALEILEAFLDSDSWEERRDAAEALGHLGDKQVTPALCELLNDSNTDVLEAVSTALAELEDETAFEPLLQALNESPLKDRWAIASAYSQIQDERAIPALIDALGSDDLVTHHRECLRDALSNQGEKAIEALVDSVLAGGTGAWVLAQIELQTDSEIAQMHEAITNRDLETLAIIYPFFLYLDQDNDGDDIDESLSAAEQEILAEALLACGDKEMAESFANFHNEIFGGGKILQDAADEWADQHGYIFILSD